MSPCRPGITHVRPIVAFAEQLEAIPGSTTSPLVAALRFAASLLPETSTRVHRDVHRQVETRLTTPVAHHGRTERGLFVDKSPAIGREPPGRLDE
jgi:hypothetical protein